MGAGRTNSGGAAVTPTEYITLTARINLNDSNPATCVSYDDETTAFLAANPDFNMDEWFGYYPCLFKNGAEVGKLNPNNYAQFEDGSAADIISGDAGDVMIAYPRMGVRISKNDKVITVSMTDNPDDSRFTYYAHTRGISKRNKFYMGAYKGCVSGGKLRSLSGHTPTVSTAFNTFLTYAGANGNGYAFSNYMQIIFRQVMFILRYKTLDSQSAVGRGFVSGSGTIPTGGTDMKGLTWGSTNGSEQAKLFGVEDPWGHIYEVVYGVTSYDSYINISTDGETLEPVLPIRNYNLGTTFISDVVGDAKCGFLPNGYSGSGTTYFCDQGYMAEGYSTAYGGNAGAEDNCGIFCYWMGIYAGRTFAHLGARLMYL